MREIIRDTENNRILIRFNAPENDLRAKSDFREKMLIHNHIEGMLGLKIYNINNEKTYEYDTSGLGTLETLCEHQQISKDKVKEIFKGIFEAIIDGKKFLLEEKGFILSPEFIFLDAANRPSIAYCPGYGKKISEQIGNLAEYLMNRIDYHDKDAVLITYTIYMKSREDGFSVEDVRKYLDEAQGDEKSVFEETEPIEYRDRDEELIEITGSLPKENEFIFHEKLLGSTIFDSEGCNVSDQGNKRKKEKSLKIENGKTILVLGIASIIVTGLLMAASYKSGLIKKADGRVDAVKLLAIVVICIGGAVYLGKKLLKTKDNNNQSLKEDVPEQKTELLYADKSGDEEATELLFDRSGTIHKEHYVLISDSFPEIELDHFPFFIGKDEEHMDFCLKASGVSRYHARFEKKGFEIEVYDLNSTNGTFLNGMRIEPDKPLKISEGDRLEIGICSYRLKKVI